MTEILTSYPILVYIFAGLFGLCIGSFLNVVIYRLPQEGLSISSPASRCPGCESPIRWFDNIPVFSYLALGGKCRRCRTKISFRYPFVELLTAGLFVATSYLSWHLTIGVILTRLVLVSALIAVTFIDLDHWIIPDRITISGMVLAPVVSLALPELHAGNVPHVGGGIPAVETALLACLFGMGAGAGSVYLIGLIGKAIFRKEAMGLGDVKLMGAAGGFLGAQSILAAFFLGALAGAVFGLGNVFVLGIAKMIRLRKRGWAPAKSIGGGFLLGRRRGSYIPFGPYLALGCAGMLFFRQEIFRFGMETWPQWIQGLVNGFR